MRHLNATDADIAGLVHTARTRSEADHVTYGNLFADCLDALINHAYDEEACSAEVLLGIAQALCARAESDDTCGETE